MYSEVIGYVAKNGKILNLNEIHDLFCKEKHELTHCHSLVTNLL